MAALAAMFGATVAPADQGHRAVPPVNEPAPAYRENLRALFFAPPTRTMTARRVGRLALQLVEEQGVREVAFQHPFRSGDRFRLAVSSNRNGWLYVLHRSPGGEPQLLWPRLDATWPDGHVDDNAVRAQQSRIVPAAPAVFRFDQETGTEYFYLVVRSQRMPPELALAEQSTQSAQVEMADEPRPVSQQAGPVSPAMPAGEPSEQIVQFSVRGAGEPGGPPLRGVVLVPDEDDEDAGLYFAPYETASQADAILEFRLLHEH